ncbi:MAG: hypothetical protein PHS96_01020 [Anaerolineales bacterium]|nr:hypothetical protein [Anaerolineales bacterium]
MSASTNSAIPLVNCLALPLGLYGLVLNVIAIKAVNQFSYGKAIATLALIILGVLMVSAFIAAIVFVTLAPAVGNVFSNIIERTIPLMP